MLDGFAAWPATVALLVSLSTVSLIAVVAAVRAAYRQLVQE